MLFDYIPSGSLVTTHSDNTTFSRSKEIKQIYLYLMKNLFPYKIVYSL